MKTLEYTLRFTTPAFLGNADQEAQWRTPPFKALIRQWWRIVKAPEVGYSVDRLRLEEGRLLGVAANGDSRKSRVQLRLSGWALGSLGNERWPRAGIAEISTGPGRRIPADVYIGYGPVQAASRKAGLAKPQLARKAIDPASAANRLRILLARDVTAEQAAEIEKAVVLANWFGTVGSRARNGWGSVLFEGASVPRLPQAPADFKSYVRPLADCLALDWPHAIGEDETNGKQLPLVWVGKKAFKDWREAVFALADTRRAVRAAAKTFAKTFGRARDVSANELVAYPASPSGNRAWGSKERLANSLRLKVVLTGKGLVPVAVHIPCSPPAMLLKKLSESDRRWVAEHLLSMWRTVHRALDERMNRLGGTPQ